MDRDELHERVVLLKKELAEGRLKFAPGLDVANSLAKVRFASDGKVDTSTVDPIVRALALAAMVGVYEREVRKIPLKESQSKYFEILDRFFGVPFGEMRKNGLNAYDIANSLASRPTAVRAFSEDSQEFFNGIREFWQYYGPIIEAHVRDIKGLKSVFGGDIFPSYQKNIATSVGLYIDTLVVPDPLLRLSDFVGRMNPDRLLFYTSKHALNALQYKDLALAEVDPPIVVVAPDASLHEDSYRPILTLASEQDLLAHAAKLFGQNFTDQHELSSFLANVSDAKQLGKLLADPRRLLFDTDWSGTIESQVAKFKAEAGEDIPGFEKAPLGSLIQNALLGRMMQANDVIFKSSRLAGHPLIDAPTSWQYLLWKYQSDAERAQQSGGNLRDLMISKAISVEGSAHIGLISNVPPEALITLRREGAMVGLRELIRAGLNKVDTASDDGLNLVGEIVIKNLNDAFEQHNKDLRELSTKKKFFGFDIGKWITVGSLAVGAAATGNANLAVLSAFAGMGIAPSIKDLKTSWEEISHARAKIEKSPSGILFRHLDE